MQQGWSNAHCQVLGIHFVGVWMLTDVVKQAQQVLQEETVCFGQLLGHSESGEQKKKELGPFSINRSFHFFDEGGRTKTELSFWHFVVRLQLLISLFSNLWRVHRKSTVKPRLYHPACARDFFFTAPTSAAIFSLPFTLTLQWVYC